MTAEMKQNGQKRITRLDIDRADEIRNGKEANLINTEVQLGIIPEQSEAILDVLYNDINAQRPN